MCLSKIYGELNLNADADTDTNTDAGAEMPIPRFPNGYQLPHMHFQRCEP